MPNLTLQNQRLKVDIADPQDTSRGTRFDRTTFITQVTLDEQHTFCAPESLKPGEGTGGVGLNNEFGNEKPIGYAEAKPGELFPKLGIGLLKRPDLEDYNFFRVYEIAQPFPVSVDAALDQVVITVQPLECNGYSVRMVKTVRLIENELRIRTILENTGSKAINTHEYNHNFIGIDHHLIGPEYLMRFPYSIELEDLSDAFTGYAPSWIRKILPASVVARFIRGILNKRLSVLDIAQNEIRFHRSVQEPFYCRLVGHHKTDVAQWEILHTPSSTGLREFDDFQPSRVAVWGTTHVLSAEVFIDINLPPGESLAWTRRWEFFGGN